MVPNNLIAVEVAYASTDTQLIIQLSVPENANIETVILLSGMLKKFPEIDLAKQSVGIFGKLKALSDIVKAGDRIEIYRPLVIDPKEARRAKARKRKV